MLHQPKCAAFSQFPFVYHCNKTIDTVERRYKKICEVTNLFHNKVIRIIPDLDVVYFTYYKEVISSSETPCYEVPLNIKFYDILHMCLS